VGSCEHCSERYGSIKIRRITWLAEERIILLRRTLLHAMNVLVGWMVGWLDGWMIGWLVGLLVWYLQT